MKEKENDIFVGFIIAILITLLVIGVVCLASGVLYFVFNFFLNVFGIAFRISYIQAIAIYLVLWIIGSFFKSSNGNSESKK